MAVPLLPGAAEGLPYDRAALARGELWSLFNAHLAHFGPNHLLWDLAVFLVLAARGSACSPPRSAAVATDPPPCAVPSCSPAAPPASSVPQLRRAAC